VNTGPAEPFWLSLGVGGMFFGGNVEPGFSMSGTFGPQMDLAFEGGLRLNPHLGLGLYADIGVGGNGNESTLRTACDFNGGSCTSTTSRVGVLLRHTFNPYGHSTPWLSLGTGFAHGSVDWSDGVSSANILEYSGWEMLRLNVGVDVRSNRVLGFGFYGGVSFTRFDSRSDSGGTVSFSSPTTNTMVQAGVRLTLFP
jgi:opacity protein-like surface antigen